ELGSVDLGDARREKRLRRVVAQMSQKPESSIHEAFEEMAAKKGAYRFFSNAHGDVRTIRQAHTHATGRRAAPYERVWGVQDTSHISCPAHKMARGMGALDPADGRGCLRHSGLAVTQGEQPLGIAHQESWGRPVSPMASRKKVNRTWAQKESCKCKRTLETAQARGRAGQEIILIRDRESDLYGLLASPRRPGIRPLIRAAQIRRAHGQPRALFDQVRDAPLAGHGLADLLGTDKRPPGQAICEAPFCPLAFGPPKNAEKHIPKTPVTAGAAWIQEVNPPRGENPVRWVRLATWTVRHFEDARPRAPFCSLRWRVERSHDALKTGCRLEAAQFEEETRLEPLDAVCAVGAWPILASAYQARTSPGPSCESFFTRDEWQALYPHHHPRARPEASGTPTIAQALQWSAILGAFRGRKGHAHPGAKVLGRGLMRLSPLVEGYHLSSFLAPRLRSG
ncbi:MAG: IS4 family transposase, partial [Planctomycetes bacterium]|nr:IS4 family transposase [Planctomycetota bacterium]